MTMRRASGDSKAYDGIPVRREPTAAGGAGESAVRSTVEWLQSAYIGRVAARVALAQPGGQARGPHMHEVVEYSSTRTLSRWRSKRM